MRMLAIAAMALCMAATSTLAGTQLNAAPPHSPGAEVVTSSHTLFDAGIEESVHGAAPGMPGFRDGADNLLYNRLLARNGWGDENKRICCKKGRRDWWSSLRDCYRANGRVVDRGSCRDDRGYSRDGGDRVCCKKGRRDWFTSRRDCYRADGRVVDRGSCRDDRGYYRDGGDRVCCKKGRRDWLTSRRDCRRTDGVVVNWVNCVGND